MVRQTIVDHFYHKLRKVVAGADSVQKPAVIMHGDAELKRNKLEVH
jgi:hypothetical protein